VFQYPVAMKAVPGVALAAVLAVGLVVVNRSAEDPRTSLYTTAREFYDAVGEGRLAQVSEHATPEGREAARDREAVLRRAGGARVVVMSVVVEPEGRGRVRSDWMLRSRPDKEPEGIEDVWVRGPGGEWRFAAPARAPGAR
jgi:hypothetical protein